MTNELCLFVGAVSGMMLFYITLLLQKSVWEPKHADLQHIKINRMFNSCI